MVQGLDQLIRLFRRDVSGRVILQDFPLHTDDVATHGHLAWLQLHSDAGSLQDTAALIDLRQVIAQDCHIGHFTPRMKTIGHRLHLTRHA